MAWIINAFIKDLQDKSSTHWSLVVTLLLMIFAFIVVTNSLFASKDKPFRGKVTWREGDQASLEL